MISEKVEAGFDRLTAAQEKTELALVQLTGQVRQTNQSIDKLSGEISELRKAIADHLKLADKQASNIESQSASIAELTKLCTVLANKAS
ncbi:MAG: hypothetical protein AAGA75_24520 [Cyanobacteria bacterium P01_E01_bin.6]